MNHGLLGEAWLSDTLIALCAALQYNPTVSISWPASSGHNSVGADCFFAKRRSCIVYADCS